MANFSEWNAKNDEMNASAVIDLSDASYLERDDETTPSLVRQPPELTDDEADHGNSQSEKTSETTFMDAMKGQMADSVWQASRKQARKAFDIYGNIDILRPYFDVEPKVVVARLLFSFVPRKLTGNPQKVVGELYGPLMVVFTLIAILLYGMKDSGHIVKEGTLMGSSVGICFGYWFLASLLFYTASYVCNTFITFLQVLTLTGYAMSSYCIVLFMGTALHSDSHTLFYSMWGVFGGLSAAKMVMVYISRTTAKSQKLIIAGIVASIHLLFLLYLHFSYHKIVEAIDRI
ncbi:protein YIPF3 isoform X2 [Strongylocentrotus purpuratus]|uniref:Protein YIPF3 n=1 Tax=Strongylocentrotus purpuratus TaxID=7668 RepID=A0A7M7PBX5_STRPU|nr:protein YIPF3 isoform X2 [Strongylocentrotus purpuratus]